MKKKSLNILRNKLFVNKTYTSEYINREFFDATTLLDLGLLEIAEKKLSVILSKFPHHLNSLILYARICCITNRYELALEFLDKAISIDKNNLSLYNNKGVILNNLNRMNEALDTFKSALKLGKDSANIYLNMGVSLEKLNRYEDALFSYDSAIILNNKIPEAYNNKGNLLKKMNRIDESFNNYEKAIHYRPSYADAFDNYAQALASVDKHLEAVNLYKTAINLNGNNSNYFYNRGVSYYELHDFDNALKDYDSAISLNPNNYSAIWNKSLTLLLIGKLELGFELYESRWLNDKSNSFYEKRIFIKPTWLGSEAIYGKTIFIYCEQGLGDTFQFCRYIKLLKELGATILFEVPKCLYKILENLEGVDLLLQKGWVVPEFDFQCPLLSLPFALKTKLNTIPNKIPYLESNQYLIQYWNKIIGSSGFKIGISWQGSKISDLDIGRSFPVKLFENISKLKNVRLISLQKNEGVEQLLNLPKGMIIESLPEEFDTSEYSFLDSAAIMHNLDLLITCDTSLGHLSGALGINTFLLIKYTPDWRWLTKSDTSPWYPNHRLFRQSKKNDWESVFTSVEYELRKILV